MNARFDPLTGVWVEERHGFPWVNAALFLATCLSTLTVGTLLMADFRGLRIDEVVARTWTHPSTLLLGVPFSLAIMAILFAHEMGHYLTCRYYGIDATLPYFIPFPSIVGTMGAFIKIRSPFRDRGSLLDVGIAGPIAGFLVAVPVLAISMRYGRFIVPQTAESGFTLGEPLIFKIVAFLVGMRPPQGMDVYMHPVTFAAWFGFLATALNLLPAAQLDGGHVTYALFRGYHKWVSRVVVGILIPLAFFYWPGWWLWVGLLLVLKLKHPPTMDDELPLERRHILLGWAGLVMLILCFTPAPFVL